MNNHYCFDNFSVDLKIWKMQPRAGESSKIKVSGIRKSFENRSKNKHEKQMILRCIFQGKMVPKSTKQWLSMPTKTDLKNRWKIQWKMMPKLTLKLTKNGPQNEPRTRQFPDKIPTPLRDAKREPKWSQNAAKRVPKGIPNPTKIDKKCIKILQNAIEAAQSPVRTPRVAERRPKRPRKAARRLT